MILEFTCASEWNNWRIRLSFVEKRRKVIVYLPFVDHLILVVEK